MGQDGTHRIGEGHGLVFAVKETAHAPNDRRRRLQGNLELGDDTDCATRTDKQIDGIHIVSNEIARSIFGLGHGVVGKVELERAALCRHERQVAALGKSLAALKLKQIAISQCDVESRDMWAHGTVGVAAGTRGVTCRHAAQTGRCLGGIGGKELLGGLLELLVGLKRCLVPTSSRQHLLAQLLAQLREHNARLHAQQKLALLIAAKAQVAIHTGSIEDMPAVGHGTGGKAGSGALNRYRDTLGMELFQNGTDLVFRCRKRDARGLARCARLIATILFELVGEGFDGCRHANSPFS